MIVPPMRNGGIRCFRASNRLAPDPRDFDSPRKKHGIISPEYLAGAVEEGNFHHIICH